MKKIFAIILSFAMMLSLFGCDGKSKQPSTDTDLSPEQLEEIIAEMEAGEAE